MPDWLYGETLFFYGTVTAAAAAGLGILIMILYLVSGKRLKRQLEQEYGKKKH